MTSKGCPAGYQSREADCQACPKNTYKGGVEFNFDHCRPCERNSVAPYPGSSSCQNIVEIVNFLPNTTKDANTLLSIDLKFDENFKLSKITVADQECVSDSKR